MTVDNSTFEFASNNRVIPIVREYDSLLADQPMLYSMIMKGMKPSDTRHQYFDDVLRPTRTTITAAITSGATAAVVASLDGITVGSVIRFENPTTGASVGQLARVSAITTATRTLTIAYITASGTQAAIPNSSVVKLVSRPELEGSARSDTALQEATRRDNECQIFREDFSLTSSSLAITSIESMDNNIQRQLNAKMVQLMRQKNNAIIWGYKQARSSSARGQMEGLLSAIGGSDGVSNNVSGALTASGLNGIFETMLSNGANAGELAIVGHPRQIRRLNAFSNSIKEVQQAPMVSNGGVLSAYYFDLTGKDGNVVAGKAYSDFNFPIDQLLILDLSKLSVNYLREPFIMDSTSPEDDGEARSIIAESTLEIRNRNEAHGKLTGLTL